MTSVEKERLAGLTFGALLRRHRLAAGLSQEVLAERARMSVNGIGALERGDRQYPYRETVTLLAKALSLAPAAAAELEAAAVRPRQQRVLAPAEAAAADGRDRATSRARPDDGGDEGHRNNLPLAPTSFHGRVPELVDIENLLDQQRLVTLTGPAGVGKTRLALEVGARGSKRFPDGVWFVDLSVLTDGELVLRTIAAVFGVSEASQEPLLESLSAALHSKRPLLLLDNCEHLIGTVADFAANILMRCPRLHVLATSREPIRIDGEHCYRVPPLGSPPATATLTVTAAQTYPAMALFAERARAADQTFDLIAEQLPPIAEVCRQLDGMPLAIELAAAQVRVLSPAQIASRLDDRFRLLTRGSRKAVVRQQTLLAAIDWSYDLLEPEEKVLFRRLGVFDGRFGLETVGAVCAGTEADEPDEFEVLDRLGSLLDKSLIVVVGFEAGRQRYRLLESTRLYARERLKATGESERLRHRLAAHVRDAVRQIFLAGDSGEIRAMDRIEAELDNIRSVIQWAVADEQNIVFGAEFVDELWSYWLDTGKFIEAERLYRYALSHVSELGDALAGRLLLGQGLLAWQRWAFQDARTSLEKALAILRPLGDERQICRALNGLAVVCDELGEFERAQLLYTESLEIARRIADSRAIATILMNLGVLAETHFFDYERAELLYLDCLRVSREHEDTAQEAHALRNLAELELRRGQHELAIQYAERSLPLLRALRHEEAVAVSEVLIATAELGRGQHAAAHVFLREALPALVALHRGPELGSLFTGFAEVAFAKKEYKTAAQLLGFAQGQSSTIPQHETQKQRGRTETVMQELRDRMDGNAFDAYVRHGRSLTLQRAAEAAAAI